VTVKTIAVPTIATSSGDRSDGAETDLNAAAEVIERT